MALPTLVTPKFKMKLPSDGRVVNYRPFLVKEEKVLLIATETGNQDSIVNAIKDIIAACTDIKDVEALPTFDIEFVFLQIRTKSVGESVDVGVTCPDDNETQVEANININDVEILKPEGHDKKIMFDDKTGLVMRYPSMKEFVDREFLQKEMKTDEVYGFIADSIDQIFDDEEVYDSSTTTKKEFRSFVDSLTTKQFEKIQKFYETSPKLSHTFKVTNPKTNKESSYTIEGLQSFFA